MYNYEYMQVVFIHVQTLKIQKDASWDATI
jgi:hypothetical protein